MSARVAMLPATLADAGVRAASAGKLRIAEATGTLWSGAGQLEIRDPAGRTVLTKRLAWRFRPGALLRARLSYEFEHDSGTAPFAVSLSPSLIELADANISWPAAALGIGVPKLAVLELTGEVRFRAVNFSVARSAAGTSDAWGGSATLQWRAAGSALTPVSPLGDYELRIEGEGTAVRATLRTLQGPLQLTGQGSWTGGRQPEFRAVATVPPQFRQQLAPMLRLIAVERGDGSFDLQLK